MRILVFGYHDIGVGCLQELLRRRANIVAVVTHRDDPGETIWFGSVAELAAAHGIPVITPEEPNAPAFVDEVRRLRPDLIFSFYYRQLLSPAILGIPPLGAINLHGSLLPKYRGRAPLNWVLVHGESVTGVTLHYMDARADHGDIIAQRAVPIAVEDTALTLSRKLTAAARRLLAETFPLIVAARAPRVPQDHTAATKFGRRTPADGLIAWSHSAWEIYNLIRAVTRPFPGAFTFWDDRRIFLWSARPPRGRASPAPAGTVLGVREGGTLEVATGDGVLEVLQIQPEGGAEMDGATFLSTMRGGASARFSSLEPQVVVGGRRQH
ncbi:MAG: formyltransferase [candidate division NC10 bacterium]|nr:formyltransferase [candidate division NC10 bacterium]